MHKKIGLFKNVTSDDSCRCTLTSDFVMSQHPYSLWGPPSLPFSGYRSPSPGLKRPGRDVHHSPPSSAEVKNVWSYASTPPLRFHGVYRCNYLRLRG